MFAEAILTASARFHETDRFSAVSAPKGGRHAGLYAGWLKRPFDIVCVLLMSPVVLPVVAVLALLLLLSGSKPFYSQARVGRNGRHYRMWKLRSMVPDADAVLERILAADPVRRAEWELKQKLEDDPRITRLGKFLRKSSLDELPQLFNVLMGHMSLVGPRPMLPQQQPLYPGAEYYRLRPGITGPWQVSARNSSSFAERAGFDSAYLSNLAFLTDILLLLATVRVVFHHSGC